MRTPSQTVGPFFEICLTQWANGPVADRSKPATSRSRANSGTEL